MKRYIWVKFQLPGIHAYPEAPEEVAYLRQPHRHMFHFKAMIEVFHDDREVEFHMFLNWCKAQYESGVLQLNRMSCEMLAEELSKKIKDEYPGRYIAIEVAEDGECGAIVSYTPTSP